MREITLEVKDLTTKKAIKAVMGYDLVSGLTGKTNISGLDEAARTINDELNRELKEDLQINLPSLDDKMSDQHRYMEAEDLLLEINGHWLSNMSFGHKIKKYFTKFSPNIGSRL